MGITIPIKESLVVYLFGSLFRIMIHGEGGGLGCVCMGDWSYVGLFAPEKGAKLRSLSRSLYLSRERDTYACRRFFLRNRHMYIISTC